MNSAADALVLGEHRRPRRRFALQATRSHNHVRHPRLRAHRLQVLFSLRLLDQHRLQRVEHIRRRRVRAIARSDARHEHKLPDALRRRRIDQRDVRLAIRPRLRGRPSDRAHDRVVLIALVHRLFDILRVQRVALHQKPSHGFDLLAIRLVPLQHRGPRPLLRELPEHVHGDAVSAAHQDGDVIGLEIARARDDRATRGLDSDRRFARGFHRARAGGDGDDARDGDGGHRERCARAVSGGVATTSCAARARAMGFIHSESNRRRRARRFFRAAGPETMTRRTTGARRDGRIG